MMARWWMDERARGTSRTSINELRARIRNTRGTDGRPSVAVREYAQLQHKFAHNLCKPLRLGLAWFFNVLHRASHSLALAHFRLLLAFLLSWQK